jgi:glycosyltransferase involved in cell wall biosynthesis
MEAMALNVPVVSPTLGHIPKEDRRNMGIRIPWADMIPFDEFVRIFKKSLEELEGISISPREYVAKYFDWRVIVKGYRRDLGV